jgi:hypothetical protein
MESNFKIGEGLFCKTYFSYFNPYKIKIYLLKDFICNGCVEMDVLNWVFFVKKKG